jgi:hypothetical protein
MENLLFVGLTIDEIKHILMALDEVPWSSVNVNDEELRDKLKKLIED